MLLCASSTYYQVLILVSSVSLFGGVNFCFLPAFHPSILLPAVRCWLLFLWIVRVLVDHFYLNQSGNAARRADGGHACSDFLAKKFHTDLAQSPLLQSDPKAALLEVWADLDRQFYDICVQVRVRVQQSYTYVRTMYLQCMYSERGWI